MTDVTIIGRGARVRGRITGASDLEIHGFVEGEVEVQGEVVVDAHGLVGSNVNARRIVVRGAVKGDLVADESIALEDGARVVGDIRAPRVSISAGALARGYVTTTGEAAPRARAQTQTRAAAPATKAAPPAPKPAARPAAPPMTTPAATATRREAPTPTRSTPAVTTLAGGPPPSRPASKQGPPPPVVPVLKKGAKGALKKKAG